MHPLQPNPVQCYCLDQRVKCLLLQFIAAKSIGCAIAARSVSWDRITAKSPQYCSKSFSRFHHLSKKNFPSKMFSCNSSQNACVCSQCRVVRPIFGLKPVNAQDGFICMYRQKWEDWNRWNRAGIGWRPEKAFCCGFTVHSRALSLCHQSYPPGKDNDTHAQRQ